MKFFRLQFILLFSFFAFLGCRKESNGPLRVSEINPMYFTDGSGKAVYLTGSHTWNNLVDMVTVNEADTFDFPAYLTFLKSYHHNFMRLWTWDLLTWNTSGNHEENAHIHYVRPHPWLRTGPGLATDGKPKFDLTRYDQGYFNRLRRRVEMAAKEDIFVSVMLFEGWGLQFSPGAFRNHPFYPDNNINHIEPDTAQVTKGLEIYELANENITHLQEAYVQKVIETIGDLDNVLFEISNENHPPSTEWQYHMIDFIKNEEKKSGKQHPVGMTFQYRGGSNETLFNSPADWISPNTEGGFRDNPPPNTGKKVIINDTDHLWGIGGDRAWVWKTFLCGMYPIFMDPYDGKILERGSNSEWAEEVRENLGYTKQYADKMDLINLKPAGELCSTGYCLANPGKEYLVYNPGKKPFTIDLADTSTTYLVEWFEPAHGIWKEGTSVGGERKIQLTSPFESEDAVVYLKQE